MDGFDLNVFDLNELIAEYKKIKQNYEDNINLLCNSLSNIESAWCDVNSKVYVKKILLDKTNIIDYLNNLDLLYNQMFYLSDNLNKIAIKFGYCKRLDLLSFHNNKFDECVEIFSSIKQCIVKSLNEIDECIYDVDFINLSFAKTLRGYLEEGLSLLSLVVSNFDGYVNLMIREFDERIVAVNKYKKNDLNLEVIEYSPKIVFLKNTNV